VPDQSGIGSTPKKKDGGLKAAATDSSEQKEIGGIARHGMGGAACMGCHGAVRGGAEVTDEQAKAVEASVWSLSHR
jgi:hypothetical protein